MACRGATPAVLCVALLALALALSARLAWAEDKPPQTPLPDERRDAYSPYERQSIEEAVQKLGRPLEPHPEGKTLEAIDIITLDVFEKRDPLPMILMPAGNFFHATTRRYVIEREVLPAVGQPWNQALVDETARNLRGLPQLSLVLCVALQGSAPGKVRLLVITKDVWSLRLNSAYTFENGTLQYLLLQPSEENLVGSHQQILGTFQLDPATIQVGGEYIIPRLVGSRIRATASANAVLNRWTGHAEGSNGSFSYGQPLYSTLAEWAWGGSMSWDNGISRRFVGGQYTDFNPKSGTCEPIAGGTPRDDPKNCRYESDSQAGGFSVTRSWGSLLKHDLTLGINASRRVYRSFDLSTFSHADRLAFVGYVMPVSDTQIGPYVEYHDYSARFVDVLDFETLALTENFRRGHEIFIHVEPVTTALRSSRDFVNVLASGAYTVPLGDGLVRGVATANVEISTTPHPPANQGRYPDASLEGAFRVVTPRFGLGRLVFDAHVLDRLSDYLNARSTLGGDSRLRGYPSGAFVGKDYVAANLEYRSRAFEIFSVDFAAAAFFDTGDAADDFSKIRLKHSVGFGTRIEFPQLERVVMRIDWGFPLTLGPGLPTSPWPGDVVVTFGQAFSVPVPATGN
jgi:hypothetical protein